MKSKKYAGVNTEKCVSCGTCVKVCPRKAVYVWKGCYAVVDTEKCVGCSRCEKVCPAVCISMKEREQYEKKEVV